MKSEIVKVLLETADSVAKKAEAEERGFLIMATDDEGVHVRKCCSLPEFTNYVGAAMETLAEHLKALGLNKEDIEEILKDFAEEATKTAFEEGEADEG